MRDIENREKRKVRPYKSRHPKIVSETILALLLSDTKVKAAELLGIGRAALYERLDRYPEIKRILDAIPEKSLSILRGGSFAAAVELISQLNSSNPRTRKEAAESVLDRVGITKSSPVIAQQFVGGGEMKIEFIKDPRSREEIQRDIKEKGPGAGLQVWMDDK